MVGRSLSEISLVSSLVLTFVERWQDKQQCTFCTEKCMCKSPYIRTIVFCHIPWCEYPVCEAIN
jgi:hypothetical protein